MGYIYRLTDLSDSIVKYIGIVFADGRTLKERIYEHIRDDDWYNENFKIEYMKVNSRTDAEAYEAHYIALYETYKYFNKSKRNWGLSEYLPNRDKEWMVFPYIHSRQENKCHSTKRRKIRQYSLDGNFIQEWDSISKAAKELSVNHRNYKGAATNLCNVLKGYKYSFHGYLWRYSDEYHDVYKLDAAECIQPTQGISVVMCSMNGDPIKTFESITAAAKYAGISTTPIHKCLSGRQKSSAGYIWRRNN